MSVYRPKYTIGLRGTRKQPQILRENSYNDLATLTALVIRVTGSQSFILRLSWL